MSSKPSFASLFQLLLDLVETKNYDITLYTSSRLLVDNNIPIHNEISEMFIQDTASGMIPGKNEFDQHFSGLPC